MTSLAAILAEPEQPLRPVLHPGIYVEAKDKGAESEEARQAAFVALMRRTSPACRVVAIPNAGKRTRWEQGKAKREGLLSGEPDVAVAWADATARIEFKDARSMPTPNQVEALNWYHLHGHPVAVCRTADGAMAWLRSVGAPVRVRKGRL